MEVRIFCSCRLFFSIFYQNSFDIWELMFLFRFTNIAFGYTLHFYSLEYVQYKFQECKHVFLFNKAFGVGECNTEMLYIFRPESSSKLVQVVAQHDSLQLHRPNAM